MRREPASTECPHCHSTKTAKKVVLRDGSYTEVEVSCEVCNRKWTEFYEMGKLVSCSTKDPGRAKTVKIKFVCPQCEERCFSGVSVKFEGFSGGYCMHPKCWEQMKRLGPSWLWRPPSTQDPKQIIGSMTISVPSKSSGTITVKLSSTPDPELTRLHLSSISR